MKRTWTLMLGLICSLPLSADWNLAMTAYDKQDYAVAKVEFERLVPFGNEDAIFNLGVMHHLGESVQKDSQLALAYFMLAAELGKADIGHVIAQLQQSFTAAQLAVVETQLLQIRQQVKIAALNPEDDSVEVDLPQPIKRIPPKYPVSAAAQGQFGYVAMRFLVDAEGNVQTIDVLDAFPERVFVRESIRALKRWKYEASGKSHLFKVQLDFMLGGGVNVGQVDNFIQKHQLWQGALIGLPQHQLTLGSLLRLADVQSSNTLHIDSELPIAANLDLAVFRPIKQLKVDFDGFMGTAVVRVADDGTITEHISGEIAPSSTVQNLVGLKLKGQVEHNVYRITKNNDSPSQQAPWVTALFSVPSNFSARFWWDKAAKNGSKEAQRIMAAYDERWEQYLLEQKDAEVMAWVGSRLLLEGQRDEGLALLDAAIAKQYQPAKALKKQLL
ncbi:TonB family protein [Rheinheimera sp. UJ63]|uniref:TonB family protein n=1 Tax=Rheinheimera sp. UJ63 TaxID=2910157 RepID=UPI001F239F81|nr:TonB family protein [Rheinheimera sp. UJ63]MCF4010909.1 TonB family protein [Rheinheimera sp. UJ63]